jgi:hypothetical protein
MTFLDFATLSGRRDMRRSVFPASHLKVAFFADNNRGSSCVSWSYG